MNGIQKCQVSGEDPKTSVKPADKRKDLKSTRCLKKNLYFSQSSRVHLRKWEGNSCRWEIELPQQQEQEAYLVALRVQDKIQPSTIFEISFIVHHSS